MFSIAAFCLLVADVGASSVLGYSWGADKVYLTQDRRFLDVSSNGSLLLVDYKERKAIELAALSGGAIDSAINGIWGMPGSAGKPEHVFVLDMQGCLTDIALGTMTASLVPLEVDTQAPSFIRPIPPNNLYVEYSNKTDGKRAEIYDVNTKKIVGDFNFTFDSYPRTNTSVPHVGELFYLASDRGVNVVEKHTGRFLGNRDVAEVVTDVSQVAVLSRLFGTVALAFRDISEDRRHWYVIDVGTWDSISDVSELPFTAPVACWHDSDNNRLNVWFEKWQRGSNRPSGGIRELSLQGSRLADQRELTFDPDSEVVAVDDEGKPSICQRYQFDYQSLVALAGALFNLSTASQLRDENTFVVEKQRLLRDESLRALENNAGFPALSLTIEKSDSPQRIELPSRK